MELGATVCLRRKPQCPACPVRAFCAAVRGDPQIYPRLAQKQVERRSAIRVWCVRRGSLLLHLSGADARRLAGLHELPTAEQAGIPAGIARKGALLARRTRSITHHRITESIHRAPAPGNLAAGLVWVPLARIGKATLSGPHRRWVAEILAAEAGRSPEKTNPRA